MNRQLFESFAFVSMRRIFYASVTAPGLRGSVTSQEASASSPGGTRGWDVFTAVCLGEVDLASGLHLFEEKASEPETVTW